MFKVKNSSLIKISFNEEKKKIESSISQSDILVYSKTISEFNMINWENGFVYSTKFSILTIVCSFHVVQIFSVLVHCNLTFVGNKKQPRIEVVLAFFMLDAVLWQLYFC